MSDGNVQQGLRDILAHLKVVESKLFDLEDEVVGGRPDTESACRVATGLMQDIEFIGAYVNDVDRSVTRISAALRGPTSDVVEPEVPPEPGLTPEEWSASHDPFSEMMSVDLRSNRIHVRTVDPGSHEERIVATAVLAAIEAARDLASKVPNDVQGMINAEVSLEEGEPEEREHETSGGDCWCNPVVEYVSAFPVDDQTLASVLHALKGHYILDKENGDHVLVGADYSFQDLMNELGGFHHVDVIRALIQEVRVLREDAGGRAEGEPRWDELLRLLKLRRPDFDPADDETG